MGTCQRRANKQEYLLLLRVKRHLFYACTYSRRWIQRMSKRCISKGLGAYVSVRL